MKFLLLAALAVIVCRMALGRWPWDFWKSSEKSRQCAQARALLGVDRGAGRDDILAAHRRALRTAHPDTGGSSEEVFRIDAARDILLEQITLTKQ